MSDAPRETPPTLATTKRALELGAAFIENDLAEQRAAATRRDADEKDGRVRPVTHCLEHDIMKAMEWASAAARLRMLAEREES